MSEDENSAGGGGSCSEHSELRQSLSVGYSISPATSKSITLPMIHILFPIHNDASNSIVCRIEDATLADEVSRSMSSSPDRHGDAIVYQVDNREAACRILSVLRRAEASMVVSSNERAVNTTEEIEIDCERDRLQQTSGNATPEPKREVSCFDPLLASNGTYRSPSDVKLAVTRLPSDANSTCSRMSETLNEMFSEPLFEELKAIQHTDPAETAVNKIPFRSELNVTTAFDVDKHENYKKDNRSGGVEVALQNCIPVSEYYSRPNLFSVTLSDQIEQDKKSENASQYKILSKTSASSIMLQCHLCPAKDKHSHPLIVSYMKPTPFAADVLSRDERKRAHNAIMRLLGISSPTENWDSENWPELEPRSTELPGAEENGETKYLQDSYLSGTAESRKFRPNFVEVSSRVPDMNGARETDSDYNDNCGEIAAMLPLMCADEVSPIIRSRQSEMINRLRPLCQTDSLSWDMDRTKRSAVPQTERDSSSQPATPVVQDVDVFCHSDTELCCTDIGDTTWTGIFRCDSDGDSPQRHSGVSIVSVESDKGHLDSPRHDSPVIPTLEKEDLLVAESDFVYNNLGDEVISKSGIKNLKCDQKDFLRNDDITKFEYIDFSPPEPIFETSEPQSFEEMCPVSVCFKSEMFSVSGNLEEVSDVEQLQSKLENLTRSQLLAISRANLRLQSQIDKALLNTCHKEGKKCTISGMEESASGNQIVGINRDHTSSENKTQSASNGVNSVGQRMQDTVEMDFSLELSPVFQKNVSEDEDDENKLMPFMSDSFDSLADPNERSSECISTTATDLATPNHSDVKVLPQDEVVLPPACSVERETRECAPVLIFSQLHTSVAIPSESTTKLPTAIDPDCTELLCKSSETAKNLVFDEKSMAKQLNFFAKTTITPPKNRQGVIKPTSLKLVDNQVLTLRTEVKTETASSAIQKADCGRDFEDDAITVRHTYDVSHDAETQLCHNGAISATNANAIDSSTVNANRDYYVGDSSNNQSKYATSVGHHCRLLKQSANLMHIVLESAPSNFSTIDLPDDVIKRCEYTCMLGSDCRCPGAGQMFPVAAISFRSLMELTVMQKLGIPTELAPDKGLARVMVTGRVRLICRQIMNSLDGPVRFRIWAHEGHREASAEMHPDDPPAENTLITAELVTAYPPVKSSELDMLNKFIVHISGYMSITEFISRVQIDSPQMTPSALIEELSAAGLMKRDKDGLLRGAAPSIIPQAISNPPKMSRQEARRKQREKKKNKNKFLRSNSGTILQIESETDTRGTAAARSVDNVNLVSCIEVYAKKSERLSTDWPENFNSKELLIDPDDRFGSCPIMKMLIESVTIQTSFDPVKEQMAAAFFEQQASLLEYVRALAERRRSESSDQEQRRLLAKCSKSKNERLQEKTKTNKNKYTQPTATSCGMETQIVASTNSAMTAASDFENAGLPLCSKKVQSTIGKAGVSKSFTETNKLKNVSKLVDPPEFYPVERITQKTVTDNQDGVSYQHAPESPLPKPSNSTDRGSILCGATGLLAACLFTESTSKIIVGSPTHTNQRDLKSKPIQLPTGIALARADTMGGVRRRLRRPKAPIITELLVVDMRPVEALTSASSPTKLVETVSEVERQANRLLPAVSSAWCEQFHPDKSLTVSADVLSFHFTTDVDLIELNQQECSDKHSLMSCKANTSSFYSENVPTAPVEETHFYEYSVRKLKLGRLLACDCDISRNKDEAFDKPLKCMVKRGRFLRFCRCAEVFVNHTCSTSSLSSNEVDRLPAAAPNTLQIPAKTSSNTFHGCVTTIERQSGGLSGFRGQETESDDAGRYQSPLKPKLIMIRQPQMFFNPNRVDRLLDTSLNESMLTVSYKPTGNLFDMFLTCYLSEDIVQYICDHCNEYVSRALNIKSFRNWTAVETKEMRVFILQLICMTSTETARATAGMDTAAQEGPSMNTSLDVSGTYNVDSLTGRRSSAVTLRPGMEMSRRNRTFSKAEPSRDGKTISCISDSRFRQIAMSWRVFDAWAVDGSGLGLLNELVEMLIMRNPVNRVPNFLNVGSVVLEDSAPSPDRSYQVDLVTEISVIMDHSLFTHAVDVVIGTQTQLFYRVPRPSIERIVAMERLQLHSKRLYYFDGLAADDCRRLHNCSVVFMAKLMGSANELLPSNVQLFDIGDAVPLSFSMSPSRRCNVFYRPLVPLQHKTILSCVHDRDQTDFSEAVRQVESTDTMFAEHLRSHLACFNDRPHRDIESCHRVLVRILHLLMQNCVTVHSLQTIAAACDDRRGAMERLLADMRQWVRQPLDLQSTTPGQVRSRRRCQRQSRRGAAVAAAAEPSVDCRDHAVQRQLMHASQAHAITK